MHSHNLKLILSSHGWLFLAWVGLWNSQTLNAGDLWYVCIVPYAGSYKYSIRKQTYQKGQSE